jgi:phosphoglycolate phosphatase-like HAD superfamily hydrolase
MTKGNIVLDLDGTLLDSRQRHIFVLVDCVNNVNETKYAYKDFCDFVSYKSEGNTGLMYLKNKGIVNEADINSLWIKKIEYKKYLQLDVLYPDTLSAIDKLYYKYNLFLITARSNKRNTVWQLSKLNFAKYFCDIMIVKNTGNVGLNKYNTIKSISVDFVVGDTEVDQKLAEYAHCTFYPLNNGFRSKNYWEQYVPNNSYYNLEEIVKIVT